MNKKILSLVLCVSMLAAAAACSKKSNDLTAAEVRTVNAILAHWKTWVPSVQETGRAPLMGFPELYKGLNDEQKAFLEKIRTLKEGGLLKPDQQSLQVLAGQTYSWKGETRAIPPQFLPRWAYEAFQEMMSAMQRDLGKKLLVESGYRSPAYQLYQFLFYLPKHGYSVSETRRWVALPGHSEHGNPDRQAFDFISQEGINGDSEGQKPEDFAKLPEYAWLVQNAGKYGFELSYPQVTQDSTYEPWHWRFVRTAARTQAA